MPNGFNFNPDVYCEADLLGFDHYIKTLSGMIRDPNFKTPFCIGIYGKWGEGKTSFMRLLEKAVSEGSSEPYVISVWFNPWRYRKEERLIIPFLKTIEQTLEDYLQEKENIGDQAKEKIGNTMKRIGRVAAAFAYGTSFKFGLSSLISMEVDAAKAAAREEELNAKQQEAAKPLADKLSSIYYDVVNHLKGFTDENTFRIVAFIDDLDRCLPETVIELLEAIKLFLDLPGYLFVIGVDKAVVEKGIAYHYRHLKFAEEENDGRSTIKADDYLDKMIQFPLDLPKVEATCKRCYIESLLSENKEYQKYAFLIETGIGDNPRTLKRFANLLAFISRHADTVKDTIVQDGQVNQQQKNLVNEHFIPVLYIKWALIVFKFHDAHKMIQGNWHRLIDMQDIASGELGEGREKLVESIPMSESLKGILKEGKQFPDDNWFLGTLVHLARATTIVQPDAKAEIRGTGPAVRPESSSYRPGDMAIVNKGAFLYGEEKREQPVDYDYYMDVFPVTNGQYQEFLNAPENKDYLPPYVEEEFAKPYNWDRKKRTFPKGKGDHPVVLVSYEDAVAFCKWRTKKENLSEDEAYRLPTEIEWEKAARGNGGWKYPWGDDFDKERCNTSESDNGGTTSVMQYPGGVSPFGCWDMAGNVWERTSSWYDEDKKTLRVLRGGSWISVSDYARCALRDRYDPNNRYFYVGFRCARTKK